MPKKKLTRAQIIKKVKTVKNILNDLLNDKMIYGRDSFVRHTPATLFEIDKKFTFDPRRK
jgi:hypothetical protein